LLTTVIQGQVDADAKGKLTQAEISKTVEFCFRAFAHVSFEEKEALVNKLKELGLDGDAYDENNRKALDELEKKLTPEEQSILKTLKGRRMVRPEDSLNIDNFTLDSIDGLAPRLERGRLGLAPAKKAAVKYTTHDSLSFLNGEARAAKKTLQNGHAGPNGSSAMNGHRVMNGHNTMNGYSKVKDHSATRRTMADLMTSEESRPSAPLDELSRHRVMSSLHESAEELETPYDTMLRLLNSVSVQNCNTACSVPILTALPKTESTSSTGQDRR
jgi:hypothetical protein